MLEVILPILTLLKWMTITKWILGDSDDDSLILSILGLSRWIYMFRILMEEMNKFLDCSSVEQVREMMETLTDWYSKGWINFYLYGCSGGIKNVKGWI